MPIVILSGDELQLPPVPQSSGLFADITNASSEQRAGVAMLRSFDHVFKLQKMMRFSDPVLRSILVKMREPGGTPLTEAEWAALLKTNVNLSGSGASEPALQNTELFWQAGYTWATVSLAQHTRAVQSAKKAGRTLFYIQAADRVLNGKCTKDQHVRLLQEPNMNATGRMMSWCPLHVGMQVRCTLAVEPPFVVPDSEGEIVGIEFHPKENVGRHRSSASVVVLRYMPVQVYVKIHDLDVDLLPPSPCALHQLRAVRGCDECLFFTGVVCVRPQTSRAWRFDLDAQERLTGERAMSVSVKRTQIPLAPANAGTLYTMQGITAEPGLIFHWSLPRRLDASMKWLAVYVALSRVRNLDALRSVGLTETVRRIIEGGPPASLAQALGRMFDDKMACSEREGKKARSKLGWPIVGERARP
jgi:hypothetical protein